MKNLLYCLAAAILTVYLGFYANVSRGTAMIAGGWGMNPKMAAMMSGWGDSPELRQLIPDTTKIRDTVGRFIYFMHGHGSFHDSPAWKKPPFFAKECYEYLSEHGFKPCGGAWVIRDTMKLVNGLLLDLWALNPMTEIKPRPSPTPDTTKPRYEYYYRNRVRAVDQARSLDTLEMIFKQIGRSMTVDQAEDYIRAAYRQVGRLLVGQTIDSTRLK